MEFCTKAQMLLEKFYLKNLLWYLKTRWQHNKIKTLEVSVRFDGALVLPSLVEEVYKLSKKKAGLQGNNLKIFKIINFEIREIFSSQFSHGSNGILYKKKKILKISAEFYIHIFIHVWKSS